MNESNVFVPPQDLLERFTAVLAVRGERQRDHREASLQQPGAPFDPVEEQ